jgi:hypothetical protein
MGMRDEMLVAGFTFIRNALKYGYPIEEAIRSVLPLCHKFYVAVGNSGDKTRELIAGLDPEKIVIIDTVWDDSLREGGHVLAVETDKAFKAIPDGFDWAFYIQGDEAMHEKYIPVVKEAMLKWKDNPEVDGLLFKYLHFYGSYDYVGSSERWYPHEIRVIKNNKKIYSYRDAQGFRKDDNKKLNVKPIDAYIYHYGWVKEPKVQTEKRLNFEMLYHKEGQALKTEQNQALFDYSEIDSLALFKGTHPKVMQPLIEKKNWHFEYDLSRNHITLKNRFKRFVKWLTGIEIGYKNYRIV